ncbi:MAG TPA: branched-chain-amino-acid transaminase [Gammaproteobacteria bacterium]|nr:branched-chain-amino-acid transaminase [Gammaproteobacteria bacterium]
MDSWSPASATAAGDDRAALNKGVPAPLCWLNGEIMPMARACIPVSDHGLLYGDGVFEGVRFYRGRAFRLSGHLRRLRDSAAAIGLMLPLEQGVLETAVADLIAAFGAPEGYLRLVVTRGVGALGLDPASCKRGNVFIIAAQMALVDEAERRRGIRAIIAATRRLPVDGLDPRIKSLNYLNHILARMEASHAGAQEAILLNGRGHVCEGSADNVFIVREGALLTPPVSDGALDGVTRGVVMALAARAGIACREATLTPYDLYTADECFLTGTGAELIPVRDIDGRAPRQCPGVVYRELQARFQALIQRETAA